MQPFGRLHTELRLYRLSQTRPRDRVYYEIGRLGPVRPAQLAKVLVGVVSRATVYRTIRILTSALVIRELPGGLMELNPPFRNQHYAIQCRGCTMRTTFWNEALEAKLDTLISTYRYVLPVHSVELSGLCDRCAQQI